MKAIQLKQPGGLENIFVGSHDKPNVPAPGEVMVQIHAGSLNYHDYLVAAGALPTEDGRILLSDGAGVVIEVGDGVTEFAPGDHVVSTFFRSGSQERLNTMRETLRIHPGMAWMVLPAKLLLDQLVHLP